MPRPRLLCGAATLAIASLVLFGCGGKDTPVKVSGVVTLEGKPLADASVIFWPDGNGRQANGSTDSEGKFTLTTQKAGDGALPGTYKVIVKYTGPPLVDPSTKDWTKMRDQAAAAKRKAPDKTVHANYQSKEKTPLRADVPPSGEIALNLTKEGT